MAHSQISPTEKTINYKLLVQEFSRTAEVKIITETLPFLSFSS